MAIKLLCTSFTAFVILGLTTWTSFVSMYEAGCSQPLGLMSGRIEDWQLSASTVKAGDLSCAVKYARLHQPGSRAWCAQTEDLHDSHWILVDLGVLTKVTGILTQGRGEEPEWVTSFSFAYSDDAYKWVYIPDVYGKKKVFRANEDSWSVATNWLDADVDARFVRINLLEWHGHPSLRLEVLGCQDCATTLSGPGIGGGLTASSYNPASKKSSCLPQDAHVDSHRAWCARQNNGNQWIQFAIGSPTTITGVVTRGRGDSGRRQWVTSYTISFSNNSVIWYHYKETNHLEAKIFGGNMDKNTERRHYFNSPFVAQYVRIHPLTWHNHIAIRGAILGCPSRTCPANYFRFNQYSPCVENLAYKKGVWSNDKRHFYKDWKFGNPALAVDGSENTTLSKCAVFDNYYAETPIWMVDLGRKFDVHGIVIVTWQGDGQGEKQLTYRDYVLNLESLTVYLSNKPRLDSLGLESELKCETISRANNGVFHPRLKFECRQESPRMRYVYVKFESVLNMWSKVFNCVLCEVYVY